MRHAQREVLALNVAGRDMRWDAAYYVALYGYYFCRAVATRGIFYSQVRFAVGLYDHAMRGAAIEGVADSVLIGQETVSADLRRSDHPLAQVLNEQVRVLAVALAGAIADDGLSG